MTGARQAAKEAREAAARRFAEDAADAIAEARAAAKSAYDAFVAQAKRTPQGHIADASGSAYVVVHGLSSRLRRAWQASGEVERTDRGAWAVSNFTLGIVQEQSITAHEVACEAARTVLRQRFPDDGSFFVKSYMS